MRHHRITRSAVAGIMIAAVAAPGAAAQQDLRSPDTRDAATRFAQKTVAEPGFPAYPTPTRPASHAAGPPIPRHARRRGRSRAERRT